MSLHTFLQTNASDTNYPNIRPTLDLNFVRTKTLDPRITYSRNSIGTYVGSDGYIKTAVANEPRFDHDPITGQCLGLLVEPSRTNLAPNSLQEGTIISPDGTLTGKEYLATGYGGYTVSILQTLGKTYTTSVWLKAKPGVVYTNQVLIGTNLLGAISQLNAVPLLNSIKDWFRVSFTFTAPSTSTNEVFFGRNGDGYQTNNYFYAWGAQFEEGDYASSYIPTTGSTVTRQADVVQMTGTNFSSWYNSTKEGTLYFDTTVKPEFQNIPNAMIVALSNGGENFNNVVGLWGSGGNRYFDTVGYTVVNSGWGWNSGTYFNYSINPSSKNKYAVGFKVGTSSSNLAINGNLMGSRNTTLSTPLGLFLGGGQTSQTISRVTYYPKRLPDSQLQLLTK